MSVRKSWVSVTSNQQLVQDHDVRLALREWLEFVITGTYTDYEGQARTPGVYYPPTIRTPLVFTGLTNTDKPIVTMVCFQSTSDWNADSTEGTYAVNIRLTAGYTQLQAYNVDIWLWIKTLAHLACLVRNEGEEDLWRTRFSVLIARMLAESFNGLNDSVIQTVGGVPVRKVAVNSRTGEIFASGQNHVGDEVWLDTMGLPQSLGDNMYILEI